tara:strand:+ start:16 stop:309 length:294 start_codon:yes stop_codon:yes gene_type:complete
MDIVSSTKKRKLKHLGGTIQSQMSYSNVLKLDKITKSMETKFKEMTDKIEQIEDKIETEHSLRNTIMSQQEQISELQRHIEYIEKSRPKDNDYNYFA